jgi:SAM-dependent methyltransferase
VIARMAGPMIERAQRRAQGGEVRVLDAGCGTGEQALGVAKAFPDVEVFGVDVNVRSLERARFYAQRNRIAARFEQFDLLADEANAAIGSFDVIISVGVLHHLREPERALRKLRSLARPEAELLGMVYGRYGKTSSFLTRDALALLAGPADRKNRLSVLAGVCSRRSERILGLANELQKRRRFGPDIGVVEAGRRVLSGRNAAYFADTYTHAQELTFTWEDIEALLQKTGWSSNGWPRRAGFPDRPEAMFKGEALTRAQQLSRLELASVYERLLQPSNVYFMATERE